MQRTTASTENALSAALWASADAARGNTARARPPGSPSNFQTSGGPTSTAPSRFEFTRKHGAGKTPPKIT